MIRLALLAALLTAASPVWAQNWSSRTDSLGYTHHQGGYGNYGTSSTDTLGNTNSTFYHNGQTTRCTSSTDSLGYTNTSCR
jgi:hypothetical protein